MSAQQPQVGYVVTSGALVNPGGAQGPGGAAGDSAMVGAIQMYSSITPPAGWMLADGSAISRTTYAALFSLIGTAFGSGDGGTTFNLPDLRGRVGVGAGQGSALTNRFLAAIGGEESHVLAASEIASHAHGMDHYHTWDAQGSHNHGDNGHLHTYTGVFVSGTQWAASPAAWGQSSNNTGTGYASLAAAATPAGNTVYASQTSGAWANTSAAGGGGGHNTMQPFLVVAFIIKVSATVPVGGPTTPIADTTQPGLLQKVSGLATDYIGGDNAPHPLAITMPTGAVIDFAGATAPSGFLLCNGAAVSRSTFSALYSVIGTTYGAGDGSTTFNVPDLRSRVSVGVGQGTGLTNRALAATGGEETHALSIAELAAHTHTDSGHVHSHQASLIYVSSGGNVNMSGGTAWYNGAQNTASASANLSTTGSGTGHNTMSPFLALNKIIRT